MEIINISPQKMKSPAKLDFQNDINGLRGISVLLVVLYHFKVDSFAGGFIGVDIFFVISGFLMTKIIVSGMLKNSFQYFEFILRRALRIFPALYFLIFCLFVLGALTLAPTDLKSLAEQSLQSVIFNSNNYFASKQGYFTAGADDQWLLHTWSLSVEWQFYVLYPVLIWFCFFINNLIKKSEDLLIFRTLLILFFLASIIYCIFQDSQTAFFSVLARAWQMIAGGLVYLYISNGFIRTKKIAWLSYLGFTVIILSAYLVQHFTLETIWPSYFAILPVVGACMVLLSTYEKNIFLSNRVIQSFGKWSYSIYLWHWPIVIALTITSILINHHWLALAGGLPLSVIMGYLSFKFIESSNLLKSASKIHSATKISAVAFSLILVSYLGIQSNGFISRLNHQEIYRNILTAESALTYDNDCENVKSINDKFCMINANLKGEKVLVLGDSHAGHLYPWFLKNSKVNTTFYVKSGCPMIVGFERVGQQNFCQEYTKQAFKLAASGLYKTVIISQNWTGFSSTSAGICAFEKGKCVPLKYSTNPSLSVEQTKESFIKLLNKNIKLVVFDATPWFGFNVPKKISRSLFWTGNIRNSFDLSEWMLQSAEYDQLFKELKNYPTFNLVSLRSKICPQNECAIYDSKNQIPIFKDHDHFNPAWIILNGAAFAPFVQ